VLEAKSRDYVENRVRAGVLEHQSVDILNQAGVGARMMAEGLHHHGLILHFAGRSHRIDLEELTGRSVMIYGQQEVVRDLIAARLEARQPLYFEVDAVSVDDLDTDSPRVPVSKRGRAADARVRLYCGLRRLSRHLPCHSAGGPPQPVRARLSVRMARHTRADSACFPRGDLRQRRARIRTAQHASPTMSRLYVQCAPEEDVEAWPDERIWSELRARSTFSWSADRCCRSR